MSHSIDMSEFYQTFFEESIEGLENIEQILLKIDLEQMVDEDINSIFRCMHSIKGGSATFDFTDISEFTHVAETYLDRVRKKELKMTPDSVDLLLKSIDLVRSMIDARRGKGHFDAELEKTLRAHLEQLIDDKKKPSLKKEEPKTVGSSAECRPTEYCWYISFKPQKNILQSGNDPILLMRALHKIGQASIESSTDSIPLLQDYQHDLCYMAWTIQITTTYTADQIKAEIFDWVLDECDLIFSQEPIVVAESSASSLSDPLSSMPLVEKKVPIESAKHPPKTPVAALKEGQSIRVGIEKVDDIINIVGELVITQAILRQIIDKFNIDFNANNLGGCLSQFEQNIFELQKNIMRIRMLPISHVFDRIPRMIHDLSKTIGKKVELKILGEDTELDKTVLEKIGDPLIHLIRNSMDHGIEMPALRKERGKPEAGSVMLNAFHQGSNIIIEISDDGNGLDKEKILKKAIEKNFISQREDAKNMSDEDIYNLIFLPGFSTADQVTDISGRGVGMDVVMKNIQSVGGRVNIRSEFHAGATFQICLPLTLSIIHGQIMRVNNQLFIFPLVSVIEIIRIKDSFLKKVGDSSDVYLLRDEYIPIIHITDILNISAHNKNLEKNFLVIVAVDGKRYGLVVHELLAQQQIVIKNIEHNYKSIPGIAGATVLGDGTVALILDVTGLIYSASKIHLVEKHVKKVVV